MLLMAAVVCYCFVQGVRRFLEIDEPVVQVSLNGSISYFPTYTGGSVYSNRPSSAGSVHISSASLASAAGRPMAYHAVPASVSARVSGTNAGGANMHIHTLSSADVHTIGGGGGGSATVGTTTSSSSYSSPSVAAGGGVATLAMVSPVRASKAAQSQAAVAYETAASGSTEYQEVSSVIVRNAKARRGTGDIPFPEGGCEHCGYGEGKCNGEGHTIIVDEESGILIWSECTGDSNCQCYCGCGCPVGSPIWPMLLMAVGYIAFVTIRRNRNKIAAA